MSRILKLIRYYECMQELETSSVIKKKPSLTKCVICAVLHSVEEPCVVEKQKQTEDGTDLLTATNQGVDNFFRTPSFNTHEKNNKKEKAEGNVPAEREKKVSSAGISNKKKEKSPTVQKKGFLFESKNKKSENTSEGKRDIVTKKNKLFGPQIKTEDVSATAIERQTSREDLTQIKGVSIAEIKRQLSKDDSTEPRSRTFSGSKNMTEEMRKESTVICPTIILTTCTESEKILNTPPDKKTTLDTKVENKTAIDSTSNHKTTNQKPVIAPKPNKKTVVNSVNNNKALIDEDKTPNLESAIDKTHDKIPNQDITKSTPTNQKISINATTNTNIDATTRIETVVNTSSKIISIDITPDQKTPKDTSLNKITTTDKSSIHEPTVDAKPIRRASFDATYLRKTSFDATLIRKASYDATPIEATPIRKKSVDAPPIREKSVDATPIRKTSTNATPTQETSVDTNSGQQMSASAMSKEVPPFDTKRAQKTTDETTNKNKVSVDETTNQKTDHEIASNKEVAMEGNIKKDSVGLKDSPTTSSALIQVLPEEGEASRVKDGTAEQTSTKHFLGASDPEKETGAPGPHIDNGPRGEGRKVMAPAKAQGETKSQETQIPKELAIDASENDTSLDVTDGRPVTSTSIAANTAISATDTNTEQNVNNREYLNNQEGTEKESSSNLNGEENENKVEKQDSLSRSMTMKAIDAFTEATQPMRRKNVCKERKTNSMDIEKVSAMALAQKKSQIVWRGKIIRWQKSFTNIKEVGLADEYIKCLTKKSEGSLKRTGPMPDLRYVSRDEDHYGNSESESDSDSEHHDLEHILRVTNDSKRQSGSSDTHSQDSGISSGQGLQPGDHVGSGDSQAKRPISAVPSEISDISVDSEDLIRLKKVYEIANELLTTEITYVSKLHLIDQVFHFRVDQENRAQNMFPQEVVTTIFSNIKSIYKFHADFLLPQLKERMERWHDGEKYQRIGDIIGKNAPYLKMYTEYVKNFDNAMGAINTWYSKNSKFAQIMDSIHSLPESGSLTLQHHMLSPIQRIPRYEMLLKEYLKKLPQDSPDRADSEKALQQVSLAATHANDAMNRIEQFKKLLEIQESIGGEVDLVSPTREVIKQGKIVKISARSGDHQERYLFLFSDLLLLCSPRRNMINTGPQYALRAKFEVDNMQVLEGDNLVTANTFYVRDDHKSVELYTHIREEKEDWLESLFQTIKQLYQKKSSLRVGREMLRPSETEIGKKQPYLQKMENVLKCMECTVQFSILKHKHHCKSCGAVVCAKCSDYKHPLAWEDNRKSRVCKSCNNILKCTDQEALTPPPPQDYLPVRPKGLLEVSASTPGVHTGWLTLRPPRGTAAKAAKRFFLLLPDFVLYSFRTEADTSALTATPLPGFTVLMGHDIKGDSNVPEKEKEKIIKLVHSSSKKIYYFAGTSAEEVDRWGEMLRMAARAEIPPECSHLVSDTQSTSSTEYENM